MTNFYRFPALAELDKLAPEQQLDYISGEVREADDALDILMRVTNYTAPEDEKVRRKDYGMELLDIIHATETALRMEFTEEEVEQLRDAVEQKNRERGYYG